MKTEKWLEAFKDKLDKEEIRHLEVHKAVIKIQLKNTETQVIELHQWEYTAKNAENINIIT